MLNISQRVSIPETEIDCQAVRSQGPGGQKVNKTASAIHLRFDIPSSSLPDFYKTRLLAKRDNRITQDGVVVIKAQRYRTQEQNRDDARLRLQQLIRNAGQVQKKRKSTKPGKAAKRRRLDNKKKQGQKKALRGKVGF